MKELCFVTSNQNKLLEAEQILGIKLKAVNIDVKEIQAIEVEHIAKEKALEAYKIIKKPVFVEDVGLYIEAWNGFPGALIKWLLSSVGNKGICRMLYVSNCKNNSENSGKYRGKNRRVTAKCCIGLYDDKNLHLFTGITKGTVPLKPRGNTNFGWDPIFQPLGYEKTYAEMTAEEKNRISHRRKAFMKLKKFLETSTK